ncbi:MAG: T9SS type B sorting domain-containing protein [Chitinophagaceae bacterium]|nr:MAG: T9SS type B sorting domain-containing protein [Chitinophagaceae bacterium]
MKRLALFTSCLIGLLSTGFAQPCTLNVNSFPYTEGFEVNEGGWAPFGTASDWSWGTPQKTVITAAGEGNKCWFTGGFRPVGYTNGENAWLLSPCFDFSNLANPEISFKVIWETEQRFDGANLQYSIDNGNSWMIVGDVQQPNSCTSLNWYNAASITYIGNAKGWSGNIQPTNGSCLGGNGSGQWLDARHTLSNLAGRPSVRFRFLFGAGTTCNNYDGFGIDDIRIANAAPANTPIQIEATCVDSSTLKFRALGDCIQSSSWNFGDPASGTNNISTLQSPTHTFSGPGLYTVQLTTTAANGSTSTVNKEVTIIGAGRQVSWPGACSNTPDATLAVTPTGAPGPYFYSWDTNPAQTTSSISNVGAGRYKVVVSAVNACALNVEFVLTPSTPITINATINNASCLANNGSISTSITGGAIPYRYVWSNAASTSSIGQLDVGSYSLTVTDANGCNKTGGPYIISRENNNLLVDLGPDRNICPGQVITLSPGTFKTYRWQDGSTSPGLSVIAGGRYYVDVTDEAGCTGRDSILISSDCSDIYFPSAFTPNADGKNDFFGPLGNVYNMQGYVLQVYDRYGNLVFSSTNPLKKWDGSYKGGLPNTGAFVWMSSFILNGKPQFRKGSVSIIR